VLCFGWLGGSWVVGVVGWFVRSFFLSIVVGSVPPFSLPSLLLSCGSFVFFGWAVLGSLALLVGWLGWLVPSVGWLVRSFVLPGVVGSVLFFSLLSCLPSFLFSFAVLRSFFSFPGSFLRPSFLPSILRPVLVGWFGWGVVGLVGVVGLWVIGFVGWLVRLARSFSWLVRSFVFPFCRGWFRPTFFSAFPPSFLLSFVFVATTSDQCFALVGWSALGTLGLLVGSAGSFLLFVDVSSLL
jgi:hypothetical protein